MNFIQYLDYLNKSLSKLRSESIFEVGDIRYDFFELTQIHLKVFMEHMKNSTLMRIGESDSGKIQKNKFDEVYQRAIYRNLVIDVWSTFEYCLAVIFYQLNTSEQVDKIRENKIEKIIDIFKEFLPEVDDERLKSIKTRIIKENIFDSHISNHQIRKNLFNPYLDKTEIEFLDFYSTLRNTMHYNFIYLGSNSTSRKRKFKGILGHNFVFEHNKPVKMPSELSGEIYFIFFLKIIEKLSTITNKMFNKLDYKDKIPNLLPSIT